LIILTTVFWEKKIEKKTRINQQIRVSEVRLISHDGEQVGVVPTSTARAMAEEVGLDLVEVSPNAVPPVAKILDWGKYRYEQQKQQAKAKAKQKTTELKGIRLGVKIGAHDLDTKLRNAEKFLGKDDKVKFALRFRGREIVHKELGEKILLTVADRLSEISEVEQKPTFAGREMTLIVAPKKVKGSKE
jgi:translation initiation factor IF-3